MKKLLLALLACAVVSAMMFVTGCGNNEEELEALRQEKEQLQEQHIQELQEREQGLQEQIQELQGEMEALLQEVEALEEKLEEPEPPEVIDEEEDYDFVGQWEILLIPFEPFTSMMEEGWLFEDDFFADGTGMSWWFDPEEEDWIDVFDWEWFAEDGQITQTVVWMNEEVIEAVWGEEVAQILADAIGEPTTVPYLFESGILMMGEPGLESILRRL